MKNAMRSLMLLGLLLAPIFSKAQETKTPQGEPNKTSGYVDFGARGVFGDVYGRPDLPFEPALRTSKMNEYRDIRDGFYIRNARLQIDNLFGTKSYFSFQAQKAIYQDQSYMASVGQWGKYKIQFRYDQTPHIFSNTTRTLFTYNGSGVFTVPNLARGALQVLAAQTAGCPAAPGPTRGCLLPSTLEALEPQLARFAPRLDRRAGVFAFDYGVTPDFGFFASYRREHMSGFRPLGIILNSSPSASLTGGYGAELPEPINYYNNDIRAGVEFGRERWGAQVTYIGSYFANNIGTLTFDNPFRTTDCVAPSAGCVAATQGPATAVYDLYPSNHADYFSVAGIFNLADNTHFMASITPGWLRQNDAFVPYTSNSLLLALTGPLPASNLNGDKQTLAMTYTLASSYFKNFQVKAQYRHYDYNNNTPFILLTPVQGDIAAPGGAVENRAPSFNRKNLELFGEWIFHKDSMIKVGYVREWIDREHRDVRHSTENGLIATVDLKPVKRVGFNASYRYSVRDPEEYDDETFSEFSGGISGNQVNSRRFDQAARTRNRLDMTVSFDPTERLSFTGFASSTQDNYNKRGGVNSSTPLNFIAGSYIPYYAYGYLKDLSWFWGADANYVVTDSVSLFAEYSHERYYHSMTGRYRVPGNGIAPGVFVPQNCGLAGAPCDSPNNDWASEARDLVDVGTAGFDLNPTKKAFFSAYYSLSAGKGISTTRPLGDVTATGVNAFKLLGASAALDYPNTTNRLHEMGAIFKFKINDRLQPKFEYRYQQWDNRDYQTTAMTPYMGCFSPIPNGPPVTNSVPGCTTPVLLTNTAFPLGSPISLYPYNAVGDTGAARYLFLGADQPSYHSHYLAATLEFHF